MAKRHTLVDTPQSKQLKITMRVNWDLCVFCQEDTGAALQCPVNNNVRAPTLDGYISLAANLTKFAELGEIPMNIDIARLNNADGIEATLRRHTAYVIKHVALKSIRQSLNG